ncbi:MAG: hypothetical protein A2020_00325 [Lentisphaerae bacterium GWF2_45_14]|nr:MAG: hypothetical protein A2020_00325 [Lentisphaerae bacterium GWF2_45_14]
MVCVATNNEKISSFVPLRSFVVNSNSYTYDNDGNLLTDGKFTYTWNGENRLIKVETADTRIEFIYDYMGRRINKKIYVNNVLSSETKFTYDGWNLVAEFDGSNTLLNSYLWGEDISGSLQGAGGVGGLLAVNNYLTIYDGNGNVMNYIDAADGTTKAEFEYRPDGTFSIKIDSLNLAEAASFSTKPYDPILDATIYQLRILKNGRWLSRDPINEQGGNALYVFVDNDSINYFDYLGLFKKSVAKNEIVTVDVDKCEIVILDGHGSDTIPHEFNFPKKCSAAGFTGCSPKTTNEKIPQENRIPGAPMDTESRVSGSDSKIAERQRLMQGAEEKAKEFCKKCCKKIKIIVTDTIPKLKWYQILSQPPDEDVVVEYDCDTKKLKRLSGGRKNYYDWIPQ